MKNISLFNGDFSFLLLCAALISLPAFEAPKTIFIILYILSWLIQSFRAGSWGGAWRIIDTVFLSWLIVAIVVTANTVIRHHFSAKGIYDVLRYVIFGWVVSRCFFSEKQVLTLLVVLIISTLLTLAEAYSNCPQGGICLELNSVGHVNHTAIFLLLAYVIAFSYFITQFSQLNFFLKIVFSVSSLIFGYAVIDSMSRAASGVWVIMTILLIVWSLLVIKNKVIKKITGISFLFGVLVFIYHPPAVINKFKYAEQFFGEHSSRQQIREFSYYAFKANPLLGVGFSNFKKLTLDDIKKEVIEEKHQFNKNEYLPYSHAHNLYFTILVEGGGTLFLVFMFFWGHIIQIIWQQIKSQKKAAFWIIWSSLGVVLVNLGIGFVNTTFHHEHALLSMFILGLLISQYRRSFE